MDKGTTFKGKLKDNYEFMVAFDRCREAGKLQWYANEDDFSVRSTLNSKLQQTEWESEYFWVGQQGRDKKPHGKIIQLKHGFDIQLMNCRNGK